MKAIFGLVVSLVVVAVGLAAGAPSVLIAYGADNVRAVNKSGLDSFTVNLHAPLTPSPSRHNSPLHTPQSPPHHIPNEPGGLPPPTRDMTHGSN